ncbi:MAG: hypothetical protein ACTHNQ_18070 [Microbacterium sp.]|uniref:hypothetical protein n=1 Tax=Microbacterium sp. TaxID=51671 RepID=UPI003F80821A
MTATPNPAPVRIDRAHTDDALYRVAIRAFLHDQGTTDADIAVEVAWCLEPLTPLPANELDQLRRTVQLLITDPTANRRPFIRYLDSISQPDDTTDEDPEPEETHRSEQS